MKSFYHLLGNTVVSSITNFTVWFSITFYIFLQTRSVFATGMISGINLVLTALSGIWFGSLVDNYKKKTVMLYSHLASLVLYIIAFTMYMTIPASVFSNPLNPMLWAFVIILMVAIIIGNIRSIALPTLVTVLVPENVRDKANGLIGSTFGISFMITSVISGLLVGHSGMYWVLILAIGVSIAASIHLVGTTISEKKIIHLADAPKKVDLKGTYVVVSKVPGLLALILFTTINNFLGGVFMALMDAYGLSLVSVQFWGTLWGFLSIAFIIGGLVIAKWGLGKNPLRSLFIANIVIWTISATFTIYPSILILGIGMFIYLTVVPFIEASEHTIIQKVVPHNRQGRVFGFAQSVEQAASPITAFLIGPLTQFFFIPFMTTGKGVTLIGPWFGTGADRGIALVFTLTGIIGLVITSIAMKSQSYKNLSKYYREA